MIIVNHICNPSAWELSQEIFHKFKANLLGYSVKTRFKKRKKEGMKVKRKEKKLYSCWSIIQCNSII